MNKFEEINSYPKDITSKLEKKSLPDQSEREKQKEGVEGIDKQEQSPTQKTYKKISKEVECIEETHRQLEENEKPALLQEQLAPRNPTEIEVINDQQYYVEYVPKEEIYPAYGYGGGNRAIVREDLSPRVKKFVKAHELYHCQDKATWGGWIGREIRANIVPGLKDPIGLAATVWKTITDIDRIKFYLKRIKEGH